ncbi:DUF1214 domain-containing protein [Corallococcus sp. M34]|uniref:DUF1254 domain-containing protein n=1 Tax=Citreicoccus inhibens TaxID=2849499 RepID=UPI001C21290A|nr:DUF1254 domain-containing protein [Citreicoccus inhibens]MBU8897775.1 DUF1214 domain-containing protein [Citreicoccus inhibens]
MKHLPLKEAQAIAYQAFMYGYPLAENYSILWQSTLAVQQQFNTFYGKAQLYGPSDTTVVTPNNDTAYSQGWLDLGAEPLVLQVPAVPQDPPRYYSFQIIDACTNNVGYVGSLTTGTAAGNYVLAPPGMVPSSAPNATVIPVPGRYIFLLGRTQILGPNDIPAAQAIMNQYALVPLSKFLGQPAPPPAPATPFLPVAPSFITTLAFFQYLNLALTFQTPPAGDAPLLERFARIGVGPGLPFNPATLEPELAGALQRGILESSNAITHKTQEGTVKNGWNLPVVNLPYFGTNWWTDYEFRSTTARAGLYANSPSEALYYRAYQDTSAVPLSGTTSYTVTFPAGQLPPASAFWSLTMYGANQFLVPNSINRYSLGTQSDLTVAADGSVTIYIQATAPTSAQTPNWLPSPATGSFYVVLRVYGPQSTSYLPPGLVQVGSAGA